VVRRFVVKIFGLAVRIFFFFPGQNTGDAVAFITNKFKDRIASRVPYDVLYSDSIEMESLACMNYTLNCECTLLT